MEHWKQHILVVDDDVAILDCIRMSIKRYSLPDNYYQRFSGSFGTAKK